MSNENRQRELVQNYKKDFSYIPVSDENAVKGSNILIIIITHNRILQIPGRDLFNNRYNVNLDKLCEAQRQLSVTVFIVIMEIKV